MYGPMGHPYHHYNYSIAGLSNQRIFEAKAKYWDLTFCHIEALAIFLKCCIADTLIVSALNCFRDYIREIAKILHAHRSCSFGTKVEFCSLKISWHCSFTVQTVKKLNITYPGMGYCKNVNFG